MRTKFCIGDWVSVAQTVRVDYPNKESKDRTFLFSEQSPPLIGQVCGMVQRYTGTLEKHSVEFEPNQLKNTKGVWLYQVRTSMSGKPMECLEKDISIIENAICVFRENKLMKLPFKIVYTRPEDRKALSDIMREVAKDQKRDAKGRFIPNEKKSLEGMMTYATTPRLG